MKAGFYTIMAAQFFSSLADNALLIAAIRLLQEMQEPEWMQPSLQQSFVLFYVILAPLVGAFADSMPKGKVMLITNGVKVVGCLMMMFTVHPLIAYAIVGLGAAAYSPAKYGILTELLPPQQLVIANGWIEGTTVGSIILGVLLGGVLVSPKVATTLLAFDLPVIDTGVDTPPGAAISVIMGLYVIAAIFNRFIPDTGVDHRIVSRNPLYLIREFAHCNALLWRDKLGQISLATTTMFWGAGATLKFIVLAWAAKALGFDLSQASYLQGVVAVGIALGAVAAARWVSLRRAVDVLPIGAVMGIVVMSMILVTSLPIAVTLMIAIGVCAGFLRRADERAAAASRPRADGRRAFDRGTEFQREHRHPRDGRRLRADAARGNRHQRRDRDVRRVRVGRDGARDDPPPRQSGPRRFAASHRHRPRRRGPPVGRLEQDRPVGKLVRSGNAGAREMLREKRVDLADPRDDAFLELALCGTPPPFRGRSRPTLRRRPWREFRDRRRSRRRGRRAAGRRARRSSPRCPRR